ncbi:Neuronal PAS domain-containing protein 2, partial [Stegodyphus mimosarum]
MQRLLAASLKRGNSGPPPRCSFRCRMKEKSQPRSEAATYQSVHFTGDISLCEEDENSAKHPKPSCIVTHMFKAFVRVVDPNPYNQLSLEEATADEYVTRHSLDGTILFSDHRISTVTGHLPQEVLGKSAYKYIVDEDISIALFAHHLMFSNQNGTGMIVYRLRTRDNKFVYLKSVGCLQMNSSSTKVDHFVCVNQQLSDADGGAQLKYFVDRFIPHIKGSSTASLFESVKNFQVASLKALNKGILVSPRVENKSPNTQLSEISQVDNNLNKSENPKKISRNKNANDNSIGSVSKCDVKKRSRRNLKSESVKGNNFSDKKLLVISNAKQDIVSCVPPTFPLYLKNLDSLGSSSSVCAQDNVSKIPKKLKKVVFADNFQEININSVGCNPPKKESVAVSQISDINVPLNCCSPATESAVSQIAGIIPSLNLHSPKDDSVAVNQILNFNPSLNLHCPTTETTAANQMLGINPSFNLHNPTHGSLDINQVLSMNPSLNLQTITSVYLNSNTVSYSASKESDTMQKHNVYINDNLISNVPEYSINESLACSSSSDLALLDCTVIYSSNSSETVKTIPERCQQLLKTDGKGTRNSVQSLCSKDHFCNGIECCGKVNKQSFDNGNVSAPECHFQLQDLYSSNKTDFSSIQLMHVDPVSDVQVQVSHAGENVGEFIAMNHVSLPENIFEIDNITTDFSLLKPSDAEAMLLDNSLWSSEDCSEFNLPKGILNEGTSEAAVSSGACSGNLQTEYLNTGAKNEVKTNLVQEDLPSLLDSTLPLDDPSLLTANGWTDYLDASDLLNSSASDVPLNNDEPFSIDIAPLDKSVDHW